MATLLDSTMPETLGDMRERKVRRAGFNKYCHELRIRSLIFLERCSQKIEIHLKVVLRARLHINIDRDIDI